MFTCNSFIHTPYVSCFGLDPDTPAVDYEIHFVRATDPAYLPPDAEAWPLYYHAALDALRGFPAAFEAVRAAVTILGDRLRGHRALPPLPAGTPRLPNEPNPLPTYPNLGPRTFFLKPQTGPIEPNS